jgi:hypothetical protein
MALTDDLVSYWKMDETSGTRYDSNGYVVNDLADFNTVGYDTGVISNGGSFFAGSSEYLYRDSNTSLQLGSTNWTMAFWCKLAASNGYQTFIAKRSDTTNDREYQVWNCDGVIQIQVSSSGTLFDTTLNLYPELYPPPAGTWTFITTWYNGTSVFIQGNNGDVYSTSCAGVYNGDAQFRLGVSRDPGGDNLTGMIDEVGLWKCVLSSADKTKLYNGGTALTYPFHPYPTITSETAVIEAIEGTYFTANSAYLQIAPYTVGDVTYRVDDYMGTAGAGYILYASSEAWLSRSPSKSPSLSYSPSTSPSISPSKSPSISPSISPSQSPSDSASPSISLSISPSVSPTATLVDTIAVDYGSEDRGHGWREEMVY